MEQPSFTVVTRSLTRVPSRREVLLTRLGRAQARLPRSGKRNR